MAIEKRPFHELLGKMVVTKEGKKLGIAKDITFETRTGELIQLVLREPTKFTQSLQLERTRENEILLPYNSIMAVGDFIVISEEDLV